MAVARSKIVLVSAAAVLSAAVAVAGVLLLVGNAGPKYEGFDPGDPPITNTNAAREVGGLYAVAYNKGNDKVALRINGYPITTAEVLEERAGVEAGIVNMRSLVSRLEREGVPYVHELSGDYSFLSDGVSTVPAYIGEVYVPLLALQERYSLDTLALASLVTRYMALGPAIEQGYGLTDAEVQKRVEEKREAWHKSLEDDNPDDNVIVIFSPDYRTREYIKGVGEEVYWNEILPERVFREDTMTAWRTAYMEGTDNNGGSGRKWSLDSLYKMLLASVEVEFTKHYKLDASLEDVRAYLQERDE